MHSSLFLGAYWGPREESLESCANRLRELLPTLGLIDPVFQHWFHKGGSRKEALKHEIDIKTDDLSKTLANGLISRDSDQVAIPRAGARVGFWTGQSDKMAASITVKCGSGISAGGVSNSVVLTFPSAWVDTSSKRIKEVAREALYAVVKSFKPEWAIVTATDHLSKVREANQCGPFVGWISYFESVTAVESRSLPLNLQERLTDDGLLLLAGQSFDWRDATVDREIRNLQDALLDSKLI